ncbi:Hypothetical predicted protein [Lecanosticta acicola]|uniref:Uncharacterized protein n=1 Tax=Lecanosticta acicola TaxID=111012 RepID=A0AAI8YZ60_9PEZI|nr:Hypothetical predicted protein [Lecanosticta acicola]
MDFSSFYYNSKQPSSQYQAAVATRQAAQQQQLPYPTLDIVLQRNICLFFGQVESLAWLIAVGISAFYVCQFAAYTICRLQRQQPALYKNFLLAPAFVAPACVFYFAQDVDRTALGFYDELPFVREVGARVLRLEGLLGVAVGILWLYLKYMQGAYVPPSRTQQLTQHLETAVLGVWTRSQ